MMTRNPIVIITAFVALLLIECLCAGMRWFDQMRRP